MKKIVTRLGSSSYVLLFTLGIVMSLGALALVAASATSRQSADSSDNLAVAQDPSKPYAEAAADKFQPVRIVGDGVAGSWDYPADTQFPKIPAVVTVNALINDNNGSIGTGNFTQSETSLVAFGNTIVVGFNDSGSFTGGFSAFTGWARSTDGGGSWTDGGRLPASTVGDAGDPVLARNETTGRIYFSTLGFNSPQTIQVFRSDDSGASWQAPIVGTPGGSNEDKQWITVDNFAGAGNGNVYLASRRFAGSPLGINFYRSTDHGATFGPSGGTPIVTGMQGTFITVSPNHSVHVFWYAGATLQVRKSTDGGLTFASAVTVASGLVGGTNGDLGLTGIRNGVGTPASFRSSEFPHATVNPASGNIYVTYANDGPGTDKCNVFLTQSTDGGATWSAPLTVNDDATTTDQWMPTVVVSTAGDRLGVFYYSRQEDPVNNNLFKRYGRIASIAGGTLTFQPSFAVSDTASLPEFGRDTPVNTTYMGDYDQAFATAGFFHVIWSDNRSDLPSGSPRKDPNVYYEKIPLGLAVTTTVPAIGSVVFSQPTSFVVNVTDPVDAATLQASDLTVNGVPANSVNYTPGTTTMTFNYSTTPVLTQGVQTMHIAGGAFLRASDGNPVLDFTGTFRYDALQLQVISTVPPFPGGSFTLPSPFTLDVNFNEAVDPSSVQANDLTLSGIPGASVTMVSVINANMTARFTLSVAAPGTLTASIAAGAINDQFGNPGAAFSANYSVGANCTPVTSLLENFDGVTQPALPGGWTASNAQGPAPLWVTSNAGVPTPVADSAPNAAFIDDPAVVSDKLLVAPSIPIASTFAQVTFRQNRNLETGFDGGVLEISLNGGAFQDIIAAGGTFVTGGYTHTISTNFSSPISGRMAWSSTTSGAFVTTTVSFPPAAVGQNAVLRWRMASDTSVSNQGWRIDNVSVSDCIPFTPTPSPTPTSTSTATSTATATATATATVTATATATVPPSPTPSITPSPTPSPLSCGLVIGSGLTLGYAPNGWNPTLATNTVNYAFANSRTAPNQFALFQTHDPWGFTILRDAITGTGHTYNVFTPAQLAGFNFNSYRVVVLNWDDTFTSDFLAAYTAAIPALQAYVNAGGVVWVQAAIQGSPGETYPMPFGGQGNAADFADSDPVVDPASPMMPGMPNPIPGDSASHVSYTGLPASAHVVVISGNNSQPVLYTLQQCAPVPQLVYGISNGFGTEANNRVYQINPANGDLTNIVQVTLPGFTIFKSVAMASRPNDGVLFAVVQTVASGSGGRRLVTVNPTTGVCTDVGPLTQAIACLSFRSNGTLYGVSGQGGPNPETLFTINTSTAAETIAFALGNGADGEIIAFHGNGLLYHSSGNANALFESINVDTQVVTPIGSAVGEAFAMGYSAVNGQLYLSDINSDLFTVNIATGARTFVGAMSDQLGGSSDNRALAFIIPCSFSESFDGVTAPTLPVGWMATQGTNIPGAPPWVTSAVSPDTAPNDAFSTDPLNILDNYLITPPIAISSALAQVTFRNNYDLESTFDGGVLEISSPNINGGAFTDITNAAVGGSFVAGGYTGPISTNFGSPIAGRMAWSGSSGGYLATVAGLGPNVAGQTIKLRFRMASDNSVSATGWRIDTIFVTGVTCAGCSTPSSWATVANYPVIIESPAVGTNGTYLYSAAGFAGAPSNGFYRYDPVANSWATLPSLPANLYDARAVYAPNTNSFYVFGGYNGSNALNTTYIYNVATNSWTTGAVMPGGRVFPGVVYYGATGKIYVIGGFDDSFTEANQTWEYDPVANTWDTTRANIPVAMGGSGASIVGQFIYLAGSFGGVSGSTTHYRYDIVANTWAPKAAVPVGIYVPASAAVGGQIFVVGGGNPARPAPDLDIRQKILRPAAPDVSYNSTYIYDTTTDSWSPGPNTNVAHSFTNGAAIGNRVFVVCGYNGSADTNTVEVNATSGCANISGTITDCANPSLPPVPNVTMSLTGSSGTSSLTDGSGNYSLAPFLGGFYTVTPSKAGLTPGGGGSNINTIDIVAVQRHFLVQGPPLIGCRLAAADVNVDNFVNTIDVVAIQRFFIGVTTGIANVGKYKFTPASRSYSPLTSAQTGQNYDAFVFGDVAAPFIHRPAGPAPDAAGNDSDSTDLPPTVAAITLPSVALDQSKGDLVVPVTATGIEANNRLVGFQGDLTFDERVISFQDAPAQNAGLTAGNWAVTGNVLDGPGPIRTLRISAYSKDFTPLKGSGTLFELRMSRVGATVAQDMLLQWASAPDQFIFIDADLNTQPPASASPGSVIISASRR